ncbi:hypothetical protein D9615_002312 [Tricholomella constricta]|uniref:Uncharacterized protein n=1 Tax=Tricholomella constricta TaxID=117010 RepID=A0A8H5HMP1_9AGAR|nr:hypothetical protein D9615_002312 [Tricholomella constricta]
MGSPSLKTTSIYRAALIFALHHSAHAHPDILLQFIFPMHFSTFMSTLLVLSAVHSASTAPAPAPEPSPIPPELQPIIAAKNNLAGTAVYADDPKFNSTARENSSNDAMTLQIPLTFISAASITAGTLLVSLV